MLTRRVGREQEEEERRMLQRSWEMATALEFPGFQEHMQAETCAPMPDG